MTQQATDLYRYERKFLVDQLDEYQAKALIRRHPSLFYEPYPPRYINNFYLDTPDMDNYYDNVGGSGNRRKVRIRWYGELFGQIDKPVLEFKIKRGLVGTKHHYKFPSFTIEQGYHDKYLMEKVKESDLPAQVKYILRDQNVVLLNRYYRRYYATRDERYRVTLDTGLTFYRIERLTNRFTHKQTDYRNIVVELKYDIEHDISAFKVSGFFPFRVTKSSKYVQGIERVYF
ncbi:MAG: VTC domain-containing protein [Anaerolineales bacterium]|jgi:SPX domain protein involved in polyphosphate accumulation